MSETMVTISEMRRWANSVFDAVEAQGHSFVDLQGRNYWVLNSEEIWSAEPPDALLGDLRDDLEDIRNDLNEPDLAVRATFAWHTLDHLIGTLNKLSADLKGHNFDGREQAR